jgi:hypothetical protein
MTRSFWKLTLLLTFGVFVVITAINWRFYFATPFLEQGDIAANAMQIHQAKHGAAIYGNYSRYFFYHPGPAFFYVYALGERVLRDWLGIVPSAHNAHSLAGLLLQSFFFGAGLAIFAERFRAPLFIPVALLLACAHFGAAHNAFTSVWPPHVLLMPFFCFFAASVSVASGRGGYLPLAALAGSFLVHGHVAQSLFVVVLFSLAYVCLCLEVRREPAAVPPWRTFRGAHIAAGAIIAIFLLPLVIDALKWPNDNLALILNQLTGNSSEHKSLWKAVLYFLTFFIYPGDHDVLIPEHDAASVQFLTGHARWYLIWIGVFGFVAWAWRGLAADGGPEGRRFLRNTALFWIAAVLLCIAWAVLQSGPMFAFNSYFCYALLYVPLVLAAAAMAGRPRLMAFFFVAGAVVAAARSFAIVLPTRDESGIPVLEATRTVLHADPKPRAPKILVFSHDDWPVVVPVGLVLDREGIAFEVDPQIGATGLMFGEAHWLKPPYIPDPAHPPSIWRFVRRAAPGAGAPFIGDLRVVFSPGRLDPAGGVIDCAEGGNFEQFVLAGFTSPNRDIGGVFTTEPEAEFEISGPQAKRDVIVSFRAHPFLAPPKIRAQPMELWVNGIRAGSVVLDREKEQNIAVRVPAAAWNREPVVRIIMKFSAARSPRELRINGDPRVLGWGIRTITLHYAN